tara:strand:- start:327 stop:497 length:171 start_codon:yes stop_codon:yes gene_type:complete
MTMHLFCSEIISVTQSRDRRSEGRHVYCHKVTPEDAAKALQGTKKVDLEGRVKKAK